MYLYVGIIFKYGTYNLDKVWKQIVLPKEMFCEIRSENACTEWLLYSDCLCMLPTTSERTPVLVYVLLYIGRFYQTSWPIQLVSTVTKVYKHGLKVSSHLHLSNQKAWRSLKYGSDAKSLMPSFLWVKRIVTEALSAHRMRLKKHGMVKRMKSHPSRSSIQTDYGTI